MVNVRGQAHTLEAIIASLLLLSSVVFALQITAVTPLSASTSNQHIENQQQASAEGVLSMTKESGALRDAVLFWNSSAGKFHGGTADGYYTGTMPTEFGRILERSFGDRGIAYNVYVTHLTDNGLSRTAMIFRGEPSDNAVVASREIVVTNETRLLDSDMRETDRIDPSNFYAADVGAGGYYNTLRVEVVVWRI